MLGCVSQKNIKSPEANCSLDLDWFICQTQERHLAWWACTQPKLNKGQLTLKNDNKGQSDIQAPLGATVNRGAIGTQYHNFWLNGTWFGYYTAPVFQSWTCSWTVWPTQGWVGLGCIWQVNRFEFWSIALLWQHMQRIWLGILTFKHFCPHCKI